MSLSGINPTWSIVFSPRLAKPSPLRCMHRVERCCTTQWVEQVSGEVFYFWSVCIFRKNKFVCFLVCTRVLLIPFTQSVRREVPLFTYDPGKPEAYAFNEYTTKDNLSVSSSSYCNWTQQLGTAWSYSKLKSSRVRTMEDFTMQTYMFWPLRGSFILQDCWFKHNWRMQSTIGLIWSWLECTPLFLCFHPVLKLDSYQQPPSFLIVLQLWRE